MFAIYFDFGVGQIGGLTVDLEIDFDFGRIGDLPDG